MNIPDDWQESIKVGISTCLTGEKVRYDGNHSHDRFVTETLGQFFDFVPVCPEVECGMPVPREAIQLVGDPENPRLVTVNSRKDMTDQMKNWIDIKLTELEKENLCGFIFKSKSPSSGLHRIKVHNEKGNVISHAGRGLFAHAFVKCFPRIPAEDAARLNDPKIRETFIENIFTLKRWRRLLEGQRSLGALVDFHTRNKLLLFSHSEKIYRKMGKLVADGKMMDKDALFDQYESLLFQTLTLQTTLKKNINVLQHMMGYFKKDLAGDEKQELLAIFDDYKRGFVPLIVPMTLIKHYVQKYNQEYLACQTYLNPHPVELKLRNYY
ncbi:conserved hypothetical protein [Desulfamplus magnetovallimortis]|uniref:DUF1722 domain-containing protein n=1 Tax=Desulfamplus magnetovallimortis TaxID=1246637 RepID=A0A1W1HJ01_9BACT|nr:DUF523 and DUF1722 domain-containing protein [Desulfamplus magnetovallimortis]SLM32430.1 conserved hypothetical protein [Desulfamplus magnetovallimortis]